ncbi:MAG TPA: sporulation protein YtfJ [Clostridiales bacterium]|nr:sporulation protein YtfJ [Clostridiales bacterium]
MDKHPISDLMEVTMAKIREMVDVNTIVGEPITTPDGITLVPVSKVTFGFASGGSDLPLKEKGGFGGGNGAGIKIEPVSFIVIRGDSVRMLNVAPPASTTVDRLVELIPEVIDRVDDYLKKRKAERE